MRRLIEIATERRVTIVMFTVAVALFGSVSLSRLNVNLLPDISYPTITVRSELTGAAPVEIENLLTKPVEEARLEEGSQRYLVRTINEFQTVEEFGAAIVATINGTPVYLRDVAEVTRGFKEREAITRIDGRESVELAVYKEGDANTVQVARRIQQRLDTVRETLPDDLELKLVYDQSSFISAAIGQVTSAALWGGILAIVVLYGFLRDARATAIIAIAIPVSVIGTFLLMYANGVSLNIMSLGGIALAVGMLVDNAIVVLENIVRKREAGLAVREAAQSGTAEVSAAVVAATLTTIAVFFPMVFVKGIAGQLFRDQAMTVTFALLFSLLVALTLIPMLAALSPGARYATGDDAAPPGRFTRRVAAVVRIGGVLFRGVAWLFRWLLWLPSLLLEKLYRAIAKVYVGLLDWSLAHRAAVLLGAAAIFVSTMLLVPRLGSELIPQLSQGEFNLELRLSPGTPLIETDRAVRTAQAAAADLDAVALTYSVAGTGNRLDANPVDAGEHTGTLSVTLLPGAGRETEEQVMAALRAEVARLPGTQFEFSRPALMSFDSPLQIEIAGYDLDNLERLSNVVVGELENSARFTDVRTTFEQGNPEVQIEFDQERAARLGLAVRDIADLVVANVRGELATRYTWRDKKIDVLVRSVDNQDASVDEIRSLIVNPAADRPVTLDAVAAVRIDHGPAEIRRDAQERVAIVSANLAFGDLGTAAAEAQRIIDGIVMPPGVIAGVSGQNEEMQESFRSMQFALVLAVFLVYLVMASQFESLVHPFVILFTIPLALVGAVLALFVTGTTVNVVAFIGVIMLAGIVVNNAIVLVDLINQLQSQGSERFAAIREAAKARLRPILMTTLTTALGLLPMALGFGEGAEIRAPMAIAVIGGLLTSTLLTLVVIPVVYSLLDRKRWRATTAGSAAAVTGS